MCAIGRALMPRPKLLMVDEMSLGLAPVAVDRLAVTLARIRKMKPRISLSRVELARVKMRRGVPGKSESALRQGCKVEYASVGRYRRVSMICVPGSSLVHGKTRRPRDPSASLESGVTGKKKRSQLPHCRPHSHWRDNRKQAGYLASSGFSMPRQRHDP